MVVAVAGGLRTGLLCGIHIDVEGSCSRRTKVGCAGRAQPRKRSCCCCCWADAEARSPLQPEEQCDLSVFPGDCYLTLKKPFGTNPKMHSTGDKNTGGLFHTAVSPEHRPLVSGWLVQLCVPREPQAAAAGCEEAPLRTVALPHTTHEPRCADSPSAFRPRNLEVLRCSQTLVIAW